jgi:hypothetical protein
MHEELENFERNQVWTLVDPPHGVNVIETKWVFVDNQAWQCKGDQVNLVNWSDR